MSGDSATAESLQSYILSIYKDYIRAYTQMRRYLLAKRDGGQDTTFRSVFEFFYTEFLMLYETTKYLSSSKRFNELKSPIETWIEASDGVLSREKKVQQVEHVREGLKFADAWAEVLHAEEIIRKTEV